MPHRNAYSRIFLWLIALGVIAGGAYVAHAASAGTPALPTGHGASLWDLIVSGGVVMIFLGLLSTVAVALVIYHFMYVVPHKLIPVDFVENLLFLMEKKEFEKAVSVCRQQENMISAIALKGLQKISKGKTVIEEAVQYEGKARIERLWQNLTYLGDIAVVAPLLGLLGTILGIIEAFGYFKATSIHPSVLTQGLAKAMVNTVFGLIIAVPCLIFYAYFRGRLSLITTNTERVSSEIIHSIAK
jgi:biopolymer transport protein ExbB